MDSHNIKNIIFDLGGVIVNIYPELTAEAFAKLNGSDPVDIMELHKDQNFFTEYEKGLISDRTFRENIRNFLNINPEDEVIDKAWGALLQDIPLNKIGMIEASKNKYRTFLLSNTNHIHSLKFEQTFIEDTGNTIDYFFEKVYYSHNMHKRKPDADIFQQVLEENKLSPAETLLIDDSLPNIETAGNLGMQTIHVERNQKEIQIWN